MVLSNNQKSIRMGKKFIYFEIGVFAGAWWSIQNISKTADWLQFSHTHVRVQRRKVCLLLIRDDRKATVKQLPITAIGRKIHVLISYEWKTAKQHFLYTHWFGWWYSAYIVWLWVLIWVSCCLCAASDQAAQRPLSPDVKAQSWW